MPTLPEVLASSRDGRKRHWQYQWRHRCNSRFELANDQRGSRTIQWSLQQWRHSQATIGKSMALLLRLVAGMRRCDVICSLKFKFTIYF